MWNLYIDFYTFPALLNEEDKLFTWVKNYAYPQNQDLNMERWFMFAEKNLL